MKKVLIFILLVSCFAGFSQSRELQRISPEEYESSQVIPGLTYEPYQKVMACSGNAANDNWANAQSLAVNGGSVAGTTCGTSEAGETSGCNAAGNPSVWYKFVATSTTHFVKIDHTGGGCYFGSAVYGGSSLPTSACGNAGPISCQSSSGGPLTHLYQLTNLTVGATYYVQITYGSGGPCGSNATFNIGVTTANPGGTITNKPPISTCSSPGPGCFFNSPPTVNTITSTCTSYNLAAAGYSANSVWSSVVQFTSSASWSNFSWQAIITSNCGGGNVVWLNWALYDCSCNQLACGNLSTLTGNGLACGTCYRLMYQMELANCSSFTTIWPYQNVPSSPLPCTVLPLELLFFNATPASDGKTVNVEWESMAENNLREYRLERSDDGVNFNLLAVTHPKQTGGVNSNYKYQDAGCCATQETRYYKLSAFDRDGSQSFEKTIAVTMKNNKPIAKFAPNPANSNFVIMFGDEFKNAETTLRIFSSSGELVKEDSFTNDNSFKQYDIVDLQPGIYFITLSDPSGSELIKYKMVKE